MVKIAFLGANNEDKNFFEHALQNVDAEVAFYKKPAELDPDTVVLSTFISSKITSEVIQSLPKLKLIACRSTGYNNVDIAAAKKRGITICNVPYYGSSTVAEYTFTLLLMLTRRMRAVMQQSATTKADRESERGTDLAGKTIGVIGTGSIGMGVARIAKGFGMQVIGYDVYPQPDKAQEIGFTYVQEINDLLQASDIITLHIPFTPQNRHFLSDASLSKLKHGAIVVNTARGELVDTTALVNALKNGHVYAAALDVLESEYLLDPDELIALAAHSDAARETLKHAVSLAALQHMPNVIVTNHNAYNTREALERINQTTADNITSFLQDNPTNTV